ncbi:MAG: Ty3/Gypsy family RNase HI domain-containing protein, partial [Proteobacteria bacterium]|nr:Ty3/Gypsy family RNase HI domain-containing protein [Pseudomonadota bacterium]
MLAQEQSDGSVRPIAYASRTLEPSEKKYGVTEVEALAVVWAVKHFQHYLYGHLCHVYTDHEALKSLMNTPHPSGRVARWGLALTEVNLHIHYRPGKKNANADALSRSPTESGSNTQPFGIVAAVRKDGEAANGGDRDGDSFSQKQRSDPELLEIATYLESGELPQDPARARELTLTKSHFLLKD